MNSVTYSYKFLLSFKIIEDIEYLLNSTKINFDVIAISKSRIVTGKVPVNSLNLMTYSHKCCATESSVGGKLLTYAITFHITLEIIYVFIKLQNGSHYLLRFLIKDLTC